MQRSKDLETLIVLALVPLFFYVLYDYIWLIYSSAILLVIAIFFKGLSGYISAGWNTFSEYFGFVMNAIILCIIYFAILTPLAFFQRLFGNNQLLSKKNQSTYFKQRNHSVSLSDIEKPW